MAYKVCKFGGSSLATKEQINHVLDDIMFPDESRRFMVVSAPGSRNPSDEKVTDLLIAAARGRDEEVLRQIKARMREIGHDLDEGGVATDLCTRIDAIFRRRNAPDYMEKMKAFGEYSTAILIAERIRSRGIPAVFVDPKDMGFTATPEPGNAQPEPSCYENMGRVLVPKASRNGKRQIVVIPGFYAYSKDGRVVTFPRNGTDISAAAVANAVGADVYENWTDVDGLQRAHPKVVQDPVVIGEITYGEVRELAYIGFKLQEEAMIPVMLKKIPIRVCNSGNPSAPGTLVVYDRIVPKEERIAGVAAKKGYLPIDISKTFMNREVGFGEQVFRVLREMGVSYEHSPTGIDTMSVIVEKESIEGKGRVNTLVRQLNDRVGPLEARIGEPMAMLVVAGKGMRNHIDSEARVLSALARSGIRPHMVNMGASELSFFVGVDELRADDAVRAVYSEFYGNKES